MPKAKRSGLLRYGIDGWAVGLVCLVSCLALIPFLVPLPLWQLIAIGIAVAYLRTFCAFVQHNHAHLPVFRHQFFNRLFDVLLAQNTGYASSLWQLHHNLGHHRHYLEPARDVARLTRLGQRAPMSRWFYALRGNLTIVPDSIRIALAEKPATRGTLLRRLSLDLLLQVAITAALCAWHPALTLWFFVVPNLLASFLVWWESYPHHLNMPATDAYDASMTSESRAYNRLTFNIGHHTAHHQKPTLHWSLLPAHTEKIRHRIHSSCIRTSHTTLGRRWLRTKPPAPAHAESADA